MNRIQKLEAEIQKLKKQEADKKKAKYQYLVGKCIHMAHTSYEKITAIVRVNTDEIGDEVVFDCIHVYFDNREDVSNSDSSIQLASYAGEYVERIEKNIISQEVFDKAMDYHWIIRNWSLSLLVGLHSLQRSFWFGRIMLHLFPVRMIGVIVSFSF